MTGLRTGTVTASSAAYCAWCASHHHFRCDGSTVAGADCGCATVAHDLAAVPDLVAAAMRLHVRSDLFGDTAANLAAEYRAGVR